MGSIEGIMAQGHATKLEVSPRSNSEVAMRLVFSAKRLLRRSTGIVIASAALCAGLRAQATGCVTSRPVLTGDWLLVVELVGGDSARVQAPAEMHVALGPMRQGGGGDEARCPLWYEGQLQGPQGRQSLLWSREIRGIAISDVRVRLTLLSGVTLDGAIVGIDTVAGTVEHGTEMYGRFRMIRLHPPSHSPEKRAS